MSLDCSLRTLTAEQNKRNHGYFDAIKGISSQALEDLKSQKQEHCAILYSVKDFVSVNEMRFHFAFKFAFILSKIF